MSQSLSAFYVSIRDGSRSGMLVGPLATLDRAQELVEPARREAIALDPRTHFAAFGTARVTRDPLPTGVLNERLGVTDLGPAVDEPAVPVAS